MAPPKSRKLNPVRGLRVIAKHRAAQLFVPITDPLLGRMPYPAILNIDARVGKTLSIAPLLIVNVYCQLQMAFAREDAQGNPSARGMHYRAVPMRPGYRAPPGMHSTLSLWYLPECNVFMIRKPPHLLRIPPYLRGACRQALRDWVTGLGGIEPMLAHLADARARIKANEKREARDRSEIAAENLYNKHHKKPHPWNR